MEAEANPLFHTFGTAGEDVNARRQATQVNVDPSVTVIPPAAFSGCRSLVGINLRSVSVVKRFAFSNCRSLVSIDLRSVTVVEQFAFGSCIALTDPQFGARLTSLGEFAFEGCTSLVGINLRSVRVVERAAFYGCTALRDVQFGDQLESLGELAFYACTSLERITIPLRNGLFTHDNVFEGCDALQRVDLVEGVHLDIANEEVNREIGSINQILPGTRAENKTSEIRQWITRLTLLHRTALASVFAGRKWGEALRRNGIEEEEGGNMRHEEEEGDNDDQNEEEEGNIDQNEDEGNDDDERMQHDRDLGDVNDNNEVIRAVGDVGFGFPAGNALMPGADENQQDMDDIFDPID